MVVKTRCIITCLALLGSAPGYASDLPSAAAETVEVGALPGEARWSFTTAPYLWAASIGGSVAAFGTPVVDVDASFSDLVENLDFGAMFVNELRYEQYGLFTDFIYVKVSGSQGTPHGVFADTVSVDMQTLIFTAAAEYRVVDQPDASLDVMAGARTWSVDADLSFAGGLHGGESYSDGDTWVDAIAGVKGRINMTPEVYLSGWAMAGGGSSEFMWDVWGGLGYAFNERSSMIIGYRGTGVDYSNDEGFVFDVIQHGPVLGAVFQF